MFLSVLIPTYNYKCFTLVNDVQRQLDNCGCEYEVIVAEDGGRDQVTAISNLRINELPHCRYIRRQQNVGRAAIRNFLAQEAKGDWLLFIDSDACVVREDFCEKYIKSINENPNVDIISGDLVNPETLPSPVVTLRYRYEKAAEPKRAVACRSQHPFSHFTTFNLLIRRDVLNRVPFDENCKEYGYEDALMGVEMEKKGIQMLHIDNPLLHVGFEKNELYLRKVEASLRTLHKLGDRMLPYTGVGAAVETLNKYHITWLYKLCFCVSKRCLRANLLGNSPNLRALGFYKLGYFLSL